MQKGILLLENGTVFFGTVHGKLQNVVGELVFNTSMTGYQEALTDPSYVGQILTLTYPLIGNCGINSIDNASETVAVKGLVVRELCDFPHNFRCEKTLESFLIEKNIVVIQGIDTRALTRILRDQGSMNGVICVGVPSDEEKQALLKQLSEYQIKNSVSEVTCRQKKVYSCEQPEYRVAMYDFGCTENVIQSLVNRSCEVTVYPASTKAQEILDTNPDGIMLSNGPGNPEDCEEIINEIKIILENSVPLFGIGLGHQLTALAMGAKTFKLKHGHRGGNHPVKDLKQGKTYNTVQNHGYAVDTATVSDAVGTITHLNINDNTIEGIRYSAVAHTVQFHPEASVGAMDTGYVFDEFIMSMSERG